MQSLATEHRTSRLNSISHAVAPQAFRMLPNHMLPKYSLALLAVILAPVFRVGPEPSPTVIAVDAAHPGAVISPTMFGIFFEDINFAADGGLYPERIK